MGAQSCPGHGEGHAVISPCLKLAVVLFFLQSCGRDKDTYVVLHSDVNCDVPRVFQLRVTISYKGLTDQKFVPETVGVELGFPSSLALILPGSRDGGVELVVDALDEKRQIIGQGRASGTLISGGRIDLQVMIAKTATTPIVELGPDGGPGDSGGGTRQDLAPVTGASFAQVSVGGFSTCAVRSDTTLWCWGRNDLGQLRLPSEANARLTPVMADDAGWVLVTSGQVHGCGIRLDGSLSCWGDNTSGQLGVNTTAASFQQTEVPDGPWLTVTSGGSQTCAIKQDGTLWCWGSNADSQLALDPTVSYRPAPSQIVGSTWEQVTTGADHTCAIKQDGTLWCWGGNSTGQLGNQTVPAALHSKSSGLLSIVGVWTEVSAGQKHTCAIASDKALWCWGDNSQGQLGTGNTTQAIVPAAISSTGLTWEHVAAGLTHTCALATGGTLWCWGSNSDGQLGIGRGETRQVPTQVVQ